MSSLLEVKHLKMFSCVCSVCYCSVIVFMTTLKCRSCCGDILKTLWGDRVLVSVLVIKAVCSVWSCMGGGGVGGGQRRAGGPDLYQATTPPPARRRWVFHWLAVVPLLRVLSGKKVELVRKWFEALVLRAASSKGSFFSLACSVSQQRLYMFVPISAFSQDMSQLNPT